MHVAIAYSENITDIETNYYIQWLEEKTGYDLEVSYFYNDEYEEYLEMLFASDADIDIVMFGGNSISAEKVSEYIEAGDVYAPNGPLEYYNYGKKEVDGAGQILWINYEWLEKLNLPMPKTTDDLEAVLTAFKENDPNGNGIKDEIALAGASEDYVFNPQEYLLQSFVYNDPYHSRYGVRSKKDTLMAATDDFREGLKYCNRLYRKGIIDERCYSYSLKDLCEIVNSPEDIVGAFTTDSISNVIYKGNPEIMARYMHVPPIKGPKGIGNAMFTAKKPQVAAIVPERSTKKAEARELLDLMMTEEASLIARFGEQGVDWDFSTGQDVSIYGTPSTIVTNNYIWNVPQNKHLNGVGPMNVPETYMRGVTWNGLNSDAEYIDARAQMSYLDRLPRDITGEDDLHPYDEKLSAYMDRYIYEFVTGKSDIGSDKKWQEYLKGME